MKLLFKQRFLSWFDSYDIYNEDGSVAYIVKGQLSWGHCFKIFDTNGNELGMVKQKIFQLLPKFELYKAGAYIGSIRKEFTFFKPRYLIDFNGWDVEGSFMEWNYSILNTSGNEVAKISKELLHFTDTYIIDVTNPNDALCALMVVLAIDAEKCSRNNG